MIIIAPEDGRKATHQYLSAIDWFKGGRVLQHFFAAVRNCAFLFLPFDDLRVFYSLNLFHWLNANGIHHSKNYPFF